MKLTNEQYQKIKKCVPLHWKPAKINKLDALNGILYVVENGCKWRRLPKEYGDWHMIYMHMNRWAKSGVLENVFLTLQKEGIIRIDVKVVSLDSTSMCE